MGTLPGMLFCERHPHWYVSNLVSAHTCDIHRQAFQSFNRPLFASPGGGGGGECECNHLSLFDYASKASANQIIALRGGGPYVLDQGAEVLSGRDCGMLTPDSAAWWIIAYGPRSLHRSDYHLRGFPKRERFPLGNHPHPLCHGLPTACFGKRR